MVTDDCHEGLVNIHNKSFKNLEVYVIGSPAAQFYNTTRRRGTRNSISQLFCGEQTI